MHPYKDLDESKFWATAVANKNFLEISGLWAPKFQISPHDRVTTFGSCFAQHIGRSFAQRGFNWMDMEPAPEQLSEASRKKFNYGVFSARTGNIYTTSLFRQWTEWALGEKTPPDEVWEKDGRYYDPFRPNIEPNGFKSVEELARTRARTIQAFRDAVTTTDILVFTLGLTESWFNEPFGYEYPMCPGTVAGEFREAEHTFVNQKFGFILDNLKTTLKKIRSENPKLRVLLTVSPVPLTATKSKNHVLVATMESKSILRAVAGQLCQGQSYIDYFPSYEIINSPVFRGAFFDANQRTVSSAGVQHVMNLFFKDLDASGLQQSGGRKQPSGNPASAARPRNTEADDDDVVCEEALLAAFGNGRADT